MIVLQINPGTDMHTLNGITDNISWNYLSHLFVVSKIYYVQAD